MVFYSGVASSIDIRILNLTILSSEFNEFELFGKTLRSISKLQKACVVEWSKNSIH